MEEIITRVVTFPKNLIFTVYLLSENELPTKRNEGLFARKLWAIDTSTYADIGSGLPPDDGDDDTGWDRCTDDL
jgi:hypothetical protein